MVYHFVNTFSLGNGKEYVDLLNPLNIFVYVLVSSFRFIWICYGCTAIINI